LNKINELQKNNILTSIKLKDNSYEVKITNLEVLIRISDHDHDTNQDDLELFTRKINVAESHLNFQERINAAAIPYDKIRPSIRESLTKKDIFPIFQYQINHPLHNIDNGEIVIYTRGKERILGEIKDFVIEIGKDKKMADSISKDMEVAFNKKIK
jgi:hypothetical protein